MRRGAPVLIADSVSVSLGGRAIVSSVSARFEPGRLIGLVGANGAGKSTLMRALAGLIDPVAGSITLDGTCLSAIPARERARRIAYLPQGHEAHWPLEVRHLVALGRLPHLTGLRRMSGEDEAAIDQAMEEAEIESLKGRTVSTLSGGERARVMLARALAADAPVLLADEPIAALDPYHQLHVMELLQAIAERGTLVLVVLHDLTLAARFCSELVVMHDGALAGQGAPQQVLSDDLLARAFHIAARHGADAALIPWTRV